MSQTSVLAGGQAAGIAGMPADDSDNDVNSGFNQDAAQLPFGFGVRQGSSGFASSNERFYSLATGFSVNFPIQGIAMHGYDHAPAGAALANSAFAGDLGASGLIQNAPFDMMRRGRIFVPVEQAVRINDRAWCRGIGTGNLSPGSWVGTALGNSYHVDCTKQAVFRSASSTAADGTTLVAVLECDFTNSNV